jgi:hypothetical protein
VIFEPIRRKKNTKKRQDFFNSIIDEVLEKVIVYAKQKQADTLQVTSKRQRTKQLNENAKQYKIFFSPINLKRVTVYKQIFQNIKKKIPAKSDKRK